MREILFRGKRLEVGQFGPLSAKEWVYGGYAKDCSGEYIYDPMRGGHRMVKVSPRTVGQYTEQTDKNGTKIFEGDICKIDGEDGLFEIAWDGDNARFKLDGCGITADFDNFYDRDIEVVGNIHDNPELLEVME